MKDDMVSVVMPAFNSQNTISDSIKSVISQSYENIELIIVDDGSTDNTINVINSYKNDKIILLKNYYEKGAAGARKTAIEHSSGRYLAFLDSDDIWPENKISLHIDFMKGSNSPFTYSDYQSFQSNISNIIKIHRFPEVVDFKSMLKTCSIGCLTAVVDRSHFHDFSYPIIAKEDYAFWLKLLKQCKIASKVNGATAFYRTSQKSLSSNKFMEIKKQWMVIRQIGGVSVVKAPWYLMHYVINGLKKHYL